MYQASRQHLHPELLSHAHVFSVSRQRIVDVPIYPLIHDLDLPEHAE